MKPTLNGRLRASGSQGSHGADHEVLEELVALGIATAVLGEIRDLGGGTVGLERAGSSSIGGDTAGVCRGRDGGGDGGARGSRAEEGARSGTKNGGHCCGVGGER